METISLPRELLDTAMDRLLADRLRPEDIEARVQREIEKRIGTVSIEEAARMAGWEPRPFRRLLKRKGVMAVTFAKTKQRLRVCDIERFIADHLIPLNKTHRRKKQPAVIAA